LAQQHTPHEIAEVVLSEEQDHSIAKARIERIRNVFNEALYLLDG
jgi:hypothetical protein